MGTFNSMALSKSGQELKRGDELFNPDCDYNRDGAITVKDFSILAANFGILSVLAPAKGHDNIEIVIRRKFQ